MRRPLWLVTGGAGFIGSHIVETLVSKGERVRVLDNFFTGKKENLKAVLKDIDFVMGDVRDKKAVERSIRGVDYVLHQAAFRSVPSSMENPAECYSINLEGTLNLLQSSLKAGVKRMVLASSSSIYGNSRNFPQKEKQVPDPVSPYALSKLTGEGYCRIFSEVHGFSAVALRYFNVFGPRQDPKSKYAAVIPAFILSALKGEPIRVHWDGKQSRDFTYVSNVVEANIACARAINVKEHVYNVSCGKSTSLLEIISDLEKILSRNLRIKFSPKRAGDVRKTFGDGAMIYRDMKFKPLTDFSTGLRLTFDYFSKEWRKY